MNDALRSITVVAVALLAGCMTQRPAPVVDRSAATTARPAPPPPSAVQPAREAKDGVYTVQRGDTLYSIALSFGVDVRDLARWNDLADAAALRVGQPLRITPPAEVATVTPVTPGGSTEVRPLPAPGGEAGASIPLPPSAPAVPPTAPTSPSTTTTPPVAVDAAALGWVWPVSGNVIDGFDAPRNKGIDIAGVEGAPVQAAADGEVVHVGSALRGYGNLVIIRHPGEYVTAYGHNRKILVAQGQQVKRGQQIAELGRSDADRPKLHFEIRHQGKPLDPVKYLPPR